MKAHPIAIEETIASVTVEDDSLVAVAEREILRQRAELEAYIKAHPEFRHALTPLAVGADAPEIVRRMASATAKTGVGPMAAVAGAVAELTLEALIRAGARHAIVENGGDIAMLLSEPATVGIFTGPARIQDIGFVFPPGPEILGICTSSGTVGHSLSFGKADAAVVISRDVCLADAAATALGNAARDKSPEGLEKALDETWIEGLGGMLLVMDDLLAMKGDLPEIVRIRTTTPKSEQLNRKENYS